MQGEPASSSSMKKAGVGEVKNVQSAIKIDQVRV